MKKRYFDLPVGLTDQRLGISPPNHHNTQYTYDKNGNLTKDLNKNISSIQYNFLNLPANITYSSGKSAAYIYDANGQKLRTSYKAATAVPTDYCGNMIYENGVLKQVLVDGGYMTVTGTPFYFYFLKDHLGSNRVVVTPAGTAMQVNHYYPFGGLFGESTGGTSQRFKYNGKEFDRTHGVDWYDYGARHMTPDAGRFTTIDPMAEKYYNTSPYAYCANNPVNTIDPNGMEKLDVLDPEDDENEKIKKAITIYNDEKNVINIWAHGSPNGMTVFDKNRGENTTITDAKGFVNFLNKNSNVWKNRKDNEQITIVLHSCRTGDKDNGKPGFAQRVSSSIENAVIIAPEQNIYIVSGVEKGTYFDTVKSTYNFHGAESRWMQFESGERTNTYKGNSLPGTAGYHYVTNQSSWYDKLLNFFGL